jgi:hypothetical protein
VTAALCLCLLFLLTPWGQRVYSGIEQTLSRFASRRVLASFVLFASVIAVRLVALRLLPVPVPGLHDEFSYLLMADTFVHGRLANPPHSLWISFETFHVNWFPTYSSMYPPVQGFFLAIGQVMGNPWIGVLLSCAILCVAIFWALQAWMPSRWAFLAAAVVALKFGITSYWINSYWGGAAAAIGGALVLGGLGRLRRSARAGDAVLLVLGIAILANSRPYEGFFFCLPMAVAFLFWMTGEFRSNERTTSRPWNALVLVSCGILLTFAFIGFYNWRLTGNALLFPHTVSERAYEVTPLFLWQSPRPLIHYNNSVFESFYNTFQRSYYQPDFRHAWQVSKEKIGRLRITYFWSGALLLLPALPLALRDRKLRLFWVTLAVVTAAMFAVVWSQSHYAAPLTCVVYGLLVQCIRYLRTMRLANLRVGVAMSRAVILFLVLDIATNLCYRVCDPLPFSCGKTSQRAALAEKLQHIPGKHLVVVRYAPTHNLDNEWVYNGAEIDAAKVLWARELAPEQNANLFAYFKDRKIWLVMPDNDNSRLEPYAPELRARKTAPDKTRNDP